MKPGRNDPCPCGSGKRYKHCCGQVGGESPPPQTTTVPPLHALRALLADSVSTFCVLFRHALRNALIPILTILGLQFGTLLAGTIVTESIFSWPGIGRLAVQAIGARDYPLLQGCILLIAVSYVFVNLLTDLVYAAVDPRVRFE